MRAYSACLLALAATLLACSGPAEPPGPLDGVWHLDAVSGLAVPPQVMNLAQRGGDITGTGTAIGVDVPIPVSISGVYTPAAAGRPAGVALTFTIDTGSPITGVYTATVASADTLAGSAVWYGVVDNGPVTGRLWFTRSAPPDTLPPGATGLEGTVTRGPVTPVCQVGVPCDAPFSAGFTVSLGAQVVARFQSDSAGRYEVPLPPGTYSVAPDSGAPVWPQGQTRQATVDSVGPTRLDLQFDTGIR